jgi:hypothetical protein
MRKLIAAAVLVFAFAGCGNKEELVHVAHTEGIYVDVAGLTYQVQMSRLLNPALIDDKQYLVGLPAGVETDLPGDEAWFGVWMRVKNYSEETLTASDDITMVDADGNEYEPIRIDPETNPFVYEPLPIPHDGVLPTPDSISANGPIQGSLLLFRIDAASLQNRPLRLEIHAGDETPGEIDIDI